VRVRVEEVLDAKGRTVACATPLGRLHLVWEADALPAPGDHDVELDVPSVLAWGSQIRTVDDGQPSGARGVLLTGTLLGLDEHGTAEVEVREGRLLVETLGEPPLGAVGAVVQLRPPRVHAHPYEG